MGNIKDTIQECIKEIDDMRAIAEKRDDVITLAQLRIMKWNMVRALYAATRLEDMLSTKKQNTK